MIDLDIARLFLAKGGRPLSVGVTLGAIFLPSSLLVYLTRPDIFHDYGIVGGIFFGAAVGFPVVYACTWPWYALLSSAVKQEKLWQRIPEALAPGPGQAEPSITEQVTAEDPLEWPTLLTGGWLANAILYGLVALAYYRPLRLGATLVLTASIVVGAWLVLAIYVHFGLKRLEREVQASVDRIHHARTNPSPNRP